MQKTTTLTPVTLALAVGCIATGSVANAAAGDACLRLAHLAPDVPPVDIAVVNDEAVEGISPVPFGTISDYLALTPGATRIQVAPSSGEEVDDELENPALEASIFGIADVATTVAVIGQLSDDTLQPLVLVDDTSLAMPGMSKIRFVHASPDAPTVDITLADGTTLFDDVSFTNATGYLEVDAGSVDLEVRDATGTTTVLALDGVELAAGTAYTVFAAGLLEGEPALAAEIAVDAPNGCSAQNYQTIYFDPEQNGQAVQVVQNGERIEGVWYVYDAQGRSTFYTFIGELDEDNSVTADLLEVSGPAFGGTFDPSLVSFTPVGTATLDFSETARAAEFGFDIDGVTGTLSLQPYEAPSTSVSD